MCFYCKSIVSSLHHTVFSDKTFSSVRTVRHEAQRDLKRTGCLVYELRDDWHGVGTWPNVFFRGKSWKLFLTQRLLRATKPFCVGTQDSQLVSKPITSIRRVRISHVPSAKVDLISVHCTHCMEGNWICKLTDRFQTMMSLSYVEKIT